MCVCVSQYTVRAVCLPFPHAPLRKGPWLRLQMELNRTINFHHLPLPVFFAAFLMLVHMSWKGPKAQVQSRRA